jgi:glycosyltransferase involved in cell wall biosynthesis
MRDELFHEYARYADRILVMSDSVLQDFQQHIPEYAKKGRVFRFPSLFAYTDVPDLDESIPASYGLPKKFMLVANQYWAHKNLTTVVEALATLRKRGVAIPVVFTGLPVEYRDPANAPTSRLLQAIARGGLSGQVVPLGLVPRGDLIDLMRCACAVLQPSLFEGWGLAVQEAVGLGRPVICSDIPVLRENAPNAVGLFDPMDPMALASLLERLWPRLEAGPDRAAETAALSAHRAYGLRQGQELLSLCQ